MKLLRIIPVLLMAGSLNAWAGVISLGEAKTCQSSDSLKVSELGEDLTKEMLPVLGVTPYFCRESMVSTDDENDVKIKKIVDDLIKKGTEAKNAEAKDVQSSPYGSYDFGSSYGGDELTIMRNVAMKKLWSMASEATQTQIFFENACNVTHLNKWPVFPKDKSLKNDDQKVMKNYKELCSGINFEKLAPFLSKDVLAESLIILGRVYPKDFSKIKENICNNFKITPESVFKDDKYGNSVLGVDLIKDNVQFNKWLDKIENYRSKNPHASLEEVSGKVFQSQARSQSIKEILKPKELEAIIEYTGSSYIPINTCLRSKKCDGHTEEIIKDATAGLKRLRAHTTESQATVFRGTQNYPNPEKFIPGAIIELDKAFISTSGLEEKAKSFANVSENQPPTIAVKANENDPGNSTKNRLLFVIKSKSCMGISEISHYKTEDEFLCPPGLKFKVGESNKDGIFTLEEVED